jgi:hypothetical protein
MRCWFVRICFVHASSPPPPPSPAVVTPVVAVVEELQELLLIREVEYTRREEALFAREEKAGDSERALAKVSADLNTERTK